MFIGFLAVNSSICPMCNPKTTAGMAELVWSLFAQMKQKKEKEKHIWAKFLRGSTAIDLRGSISAKLSELENLHRRFLHLLFGICKIAKFLPRYPLRESSSFWFIRCKIRIPDLSKCFTVYRCINRRSVVDFICSSFNRDPCHFHTPHKINKFTFSLIINN